MKRVMMIGFDGADPYVIKRMLAEDRLPNIKKVIESGTTTKSLSMLGVFPTVTPPNWVSLATGNWPQKHGVTDFWGHTLGKELDITENEWDSRRVESELIWEAAAKQGLQCLVLNYCQAWPPRFATDKIAMIDGSGAIPFLQTTVEAQKLVICEEGDFPIEIAGKEVTNTSDDCIVDKEQIDKFGQAETLQDTADDFEKQFAPLFERKALIMNEAVFDGMTKQKTGNIVDIMRTPLSSVDNWGIDLPESSKSATLIMNNGLIRRYAVLVPSENGRYDSVAIYKNRKSTEAMGQARVGEWSSFIFDSFNIDGEQVRVAYRIRVMEISDDGDSCKFLLSFVTNMEDYSYIYPQSIGKDFFDAVGPIPTLAFAGRYEREADLISMEAFEQMFDWHIDATNFLMQQYPDWQLFYVHIHPQDLVNHFFIDKAVPGCDENWKWYQEYIEMVYTYEDKYVGAMLEKMDEETTMFVTSDHAAVPHGPKGCNAKISNGQGIVLNAMEKMGYTKILPIEDGMPEIDWSKTKAVMQRGNYVYVNLKGRDPQGIVDPEEYDELVEQIISDLYAYRDETTGRRVVAFCMTRKEMEHIGMGGKHCGDIFVQQQPYFIEQHNGSASTNDSNGYSLNNLFMVTGCGIKKGCVLNRTVRVPEIVPTICHLLNIDFPKDVEGGVIYQALDERGKN